MLKKDICDQQLTIEEAYDIYSVYIQEDWQKGALYIRVSTNDQIEYSPASQIKIGLKYAIEHHINIQKEYIFKDEGISGKKTEKRLSFMQMISAAKQKPKPFDIILVYSFSRFARNREDSIIYKSMLRKKLKIEVISITQPLSEGKESILLESLYEAMDEYYSIDLAENSLRGKQEKITRGEHLGNAPFGYIYNKNTKKLEVDLEKAEIVKLIFKEYISSNMNVKRIVRKLNDMNIRSTRGGLWSDRTIKLILHNPAYIGKIRFTLGGMQRDYYNPNTQIFDGIHKPIIDINTWNKVQELNNKRKDIYSKYMKVAPKHEHWLRGILKCGDCGNSLVKTKVQTRSKAYFQCTNYVKGKCKRSHFIREDIIVPMILEQIKKDYSNNNIKINIVEKEISYNEDIEILLKQLKRVDEKEHRIKMAYENGIDDISEYKENKSRLKKEKEKLNNELEVLEKQNNKNSKKQEVLNRCEEAYKILSDEKIPEKIKMTIAHELFDKIIYDKDNEELIIYYK